MYIGNATSSKIKQHTVIIEKSERFKRTLAKDSDYLNDESCNPSQKTDFDLIFTFMIKTVLTSELVILIGFLV